MPAIVQLFADNLPFFYGFIFVLGLLIGSFLNVVIHRLPIMLERSWKSEYLSYFTPDEQQQEQPTERYNLVVPRSRCPSCHTEITALQNIPLVSWIFLKGRCANCKTKISARYPLIELITGILSVWIAVHFGFTYQCLLALIFTWSMVALTAIDIDKMLLPDQIVLPLMWLGLLVSINTMFVSTSDALIGAATGYLSLWSVYWAFKLLTGKDGMGYGDFKLLAAIGAFVGWQLLPVVILMSSLVGAVCGIILLKSQGKQNSQPIPFGPYLAIAGWITLMYGNQIVEWYWSYLLT